LTPAQLAKQPLGFPLLRTLEIVAAIDQLPIGKHEIEVRFESQPFGKLKLKVDDSITEERPKTIHIPRDKVDDYGEEAIKARQRFVEEQTGAKLEHTAQYSFDPHTVAGNAEHFTGVAQIPLGFAGPITINGEHAQGDFFVPMATTEGTLTPAITG
jgi:hydroxymethylglutaryl-CoA reductase (NADPH)